MLFNSGCLLASPGEVFKNTDADTPDRLNQKFLDVCGGGEGIDNTFLSFPDDFDVVFHVVNLGIIV